MINKIKSRKDFIKIQKNGSKVISAGLVLQYLNNLNQEHNLIEALKTNCRKTVKEKTGKRPYTNVNLVRI